MNAWNSYFFGPVAAVRPYLLMKVVLVMLAFDTWVAMAPHGAMYGAAGFNIAHFDSLDMIHPTPAYYMTVLLVTGLLAMIFAVTGMNRLAAAVLFLLYTYSWLMSRLDMYTHHYLISLLLLCFIFFPRIKASDLFAARDAHDGPYTSAWAYTLLGTTAGIVFFWCAMAKIDPLWRAGHPLSVMRGPAAFFSPAVQFASGFGIDQAVFWRVAATTVIVVELLLALCYLVAVSQDRSRRRLVRTCCWMGLVLALGLHINNELIELYIRWLSYYMMVIACVFYLPQRWIRALAAVATWPGRRLEQLFARCRDRWPVMESRTGLLVAAPVIALAMLIVGRHVDLPGALPACAVAAAALVVVTVCAVLRKSPAVARQWILAVAVSGAAMWAAVANSSVRADFYTSSGNDLKLLEERERAVAAYKQAVRYARRNNADPSYNLGVMYAALGQTDRAAEQYRQALQIDREHVMAHNNLGVLMFDQGEHAQAMEHYHKALRLQPDNVDALVNLGNVLQVFGQTDRAMQHYRLALRHDPRRDSTHFNMALLLADQNKPEQVIEHLRKALGINPRNAVAHNNLANALATSGKWDSALEHYHQALQINPGLADTHYNMAVALQAMGRLEKAIAHYQDALRIKPDYAEARSNLSLALKHLQRRDSDGAAKSFRDDR